MLIVLLNFLWKRFCQILDIRLPIDIRWWKSFDKIFSMINLRFFKLLNKPLLIFWIIISTIDFVEFSFFMIFL